MTPAGNSKSFVRPVGQDAAPHLYVVGQIVRLKDTLARLDKSQNAFRIIASLPPSAGSPQYRIRNEAELFERVATEDNLEVVSDIIHE